MPTQSNSNMKFYNHIITYIFICFSALLSAQTIQKTTEGNYIILLPDGNYEDYNAQNKAHREMMSKYQKREKELTNGDEKKNKAKDKQSETKDKKDNKKEEKDKNALVSALKKAHDKEKLLGEAADDATRNKIKAEYDWKKFIASSPEKKKQKEAIRLENWYKEQKEVEKEALKNFKIAAKETAELRKKGEKINLSLTDFPPYLLAKIEKVNAEKKENNNQSEEVIIAKIETKPKKENKKEDKKADKKTEPKIKEDKNTDNKRKEKETKKEDKKEKEVIAAEKKKEEPKKKVIVNDDDDETEEIIPERKLRTLKPEDNVVLNPPPSPCEIAFDGVDEFTKSKRIETESKVIFKHTDDVMLKFYEKNDFLTCSVSLSANEKGFKHLNFVFVFNSDNVQNTYGVLEKEKVITLRFLDGEYLFLANSKTDRGFVDPIKKTTIYKAIVPINPSQQKTLASAEIDQIRVLWGTGTDDYDIYDLDFFANLMRCIN
jgi:hypothetical protein